jgi:hypothetical protein
MPEYRPRRKGEDHNRRRRIHLVTRNTRKTTSTLSAAEESRRAVTAAQQTLATWREKNRQAAEAAEELLSRLAAGDDTPTAADLSLTEYEMKRTGLLVQAAEVAVKRAQRALINDDTELAELLRGVLAGIYGNGVPIFVTGVPADAKVDPAGQPVLYVIQPEPTITRGGVLSGLVEVVFYRPHLFSPLDAVRVDEACRALGFFVQTHQLGKSTEGDLNRDALRLTVNRAFHPVPVLSAEPSDEAVHEFARTVNGDLLRAVTGVSTRPTITGEPVPGKASSDLLNSSIMSTAPGDDGTVRVTVTTSHKVVRSAGLPEHYANRRLRDAVAALDGQVVDGVGRVVVAEAVGIDMSDPGRPDAGRAPWTVTARFVLSYVLS